MAAVKKTLVVEDLRYVNRGSDGAFRIRKVTNSIDFRIGDVLTVDKVKAYCNHPDWTVNIVGRS